METGHDASGMVQIPPCVPDINTGSWDSLLQTRLAQIEAGPAAALAERLFKEEVEARRALHSIRFRINALAPIARLPSEITARIFAFHADAERSVREIQNEERRRLGWIQDTHVCRRWRQIALEHPSLWADVDFGLGEQWMEEMVSRAKAAPLFLDCTGYVGLEIGRAYEFVGAHMHHTKFLRLGVSNAAATMSSMLQIISSPAPLLETWSISDTSFGFNSPLSTATDLLGGDAPSLRHMFFESSRPRAFPGASALLRNLQSLTISYVDFRSTKSLPRQADDHLHVHELLSTLEHITSLQRLTLSGALPHPTYLAADRISHTVTLSCLTHLTIKLTYLGPCVALIRQLEIPMDATVTLDLDRSAVADYAPSPEPLFSLLASSLRMRHWQSTGQIIKLSIRCTNDSHLTIETWRAADGPDTSITLTQAYLPLDRDTVDSACAAFCSKDLRELRVDEVRGSRIWTTATWHSIAARAPNIDTLIAVGRAADVLCPSLTPAAGAMSTAQSLFLPYLSSLELHRARSLDGPYSDDRQDHAITLSLALAARAKAGCELKSLYITQCRRSRWDENADVLDKLEDVVPGMTVRIDYR